jgi:hypothetical protein
VIAASVWFSARIAGLPRLDRLVQPSDQRGRHLAAGELVDDDDLLALLAFVDDVLLVRL